MWAVGSEGDGRSIVGGTDSKPFTGAFSGSGKNAWRERFGLFSAEPD
jgi:hypothetical protein